MSWEVKKLPVGGFAANCYWLDNGREAWLIDPAAWPEKKPINKSELKGIIVTHGHMDHILTADDWRDKFSVPLMIHGADAHMLSDSMANVSAMFGRPMVWRQADKILEDDEIINLDDGSVFRIISTPGHTSGGICLLLIDKDGNDSALFTGDTIFSDSVGRTDLGGSDQELIDSINKISQLLTADNRNMMVYPGHGPAIEFGELCRRHPWINASESDII
jgi:glyoxylase-like metal-dependent hydrolase (beta-lactamase superfamily II)